MYKKKIAVLALASLMTLSLPLIAEEAGSDEAAEAQAAASSTDAWPHGAESAASGDDAMAAMQQRMRERDARYEDLKARAREVGVMLPENPPWKSTDMGMRSDMAGRMQRHRAMMSMSPEERMAAREEHYQEMQARAKERGYDMPDTSRWEARQSAMDEEWAQHQAALDGMTDEERAACRAMHQRHMGMFRRGLPERPMMWVPTVGPGWSSGTMGPGYGYGYDPYPYAPQNFWEPTW